MSIFKEQDKAELEVKKIMLEALISRKKKIEPLILELSVQISSLKDDIERLEKEVES